MRCSLNTETIDAERRTSGLPLGWSGFRNRASRWASCARSGTCGWDRYTDPRVSSYLLVETVYFQPRVTRPSDLRVLNETLFAVTPNPRVTVGIGFNLTYDSAPPATVPPLDTQLRTTVGVKL